MDEDTKAGLERARQIADGVEGLADAEAMLELDGATQGTPMPIRHADFSIDTSDFEESLGSADLTAAFDASMKVEKAQEKLSEAMTDAMLESGVLEVKDEVEEIEMTMTVGTDTEDDGVKFGPCECSAADEDWMPVKTPKKHGVMTENLTYECLSCGRHYKPFREGDIDAEE